MGEDEMEGYEPLSDGEIVALDDMIKCGESLARLEENKDFKLVFGEQYVKAFAITNTMNISQFDESTRTRIMEKMVARSVFVQYCSQIIFDANQAKDNIAYNDEQLRKIN